MVQRLADVTIKYDRVAPTSVYDRRAADRIIVDLKSALERSENVRRDSGEVRSRHVGIDDVQSVDGPADEAHPSP
jgi:hypothetical protein